MRIHRRKIRRCIHDIHMYGFVKKEIERRFVQYEKRIGIKKDDVEGLGRLPLLIADEVIWRIGA